MPERPLGMGASMLDWIEVQSSPVHGQGVFARRPLVEGQRIGRFEGDPTLEDGTYVLWVFDEKGEEIGIEGRNALRFLNHGDAPNAEFEDADLFITRRVEPGDELLIDYGAGWSEHEELEEHEERAEQEEHEAEAERETHEAVEAGAHAETGRVEAAG